MSKSNLIAFRLPAELQALFNDAVSNSGTDKTAWIVSAIKEKLNRPDSNPDARMLSLVERLESSVASLIAGKADIPPYTYNESAVVSVVNLVLSEGIDNGRIIAERINEAGYQTKGKLGITIFIQRGSVTRILLANFTLIFRCFCDCGRLGVINTPA